jgi:alpha-mannosidase
VLERKPYEPRIVLPGGDSDWAGAAGDYPAINWAGIDAGDSSVALFNRGTPSYQINTDSHGKENIYLSVLRSPSMPTCLHAGADYTMPLYDGMRDAGDHHFTYALKSYKGGFGENSVHADGVGYNGQLIASGEMALGLPVLRWENAWIPAMIPSLDRKGLMVRVAEYRGKIGAFTLKLPKTVTAVWETDLKEDRLGLMTISNNIITDVLKPFEIKSFYLEF